jgi:thioesterase domain-containing protein
VALCESSRVAAIKEADEKQAEGLSAVFLQSRGDGAPIFFFPGERMEPWYLRHLVGHLGEDRPFLVLRHQLARVDQFEALAGRAASLIQSIRSSGPLVVAGHCFGGILAYETAQRLIAAGHAGISLILLDVPAPGYPKIRPLGYLRQIPAAIRTLLHGGAQDLVNDVSGHLRFLRGPSVNAISRPALPPAGIVLKTYRPKPFPGSLACLNARDEEVSARVLEDPRLGWRDLCRGSFLAREVGGSHDSMFEAHNAAELAGEFQSVLRAL